MPMISSTFQTIFLDAQVPPILFASTVLTRSTAPSSVALSPYSVVLPFESVVVALVAHYRLAKSIETMSISRETDRFSFLTVFVAFIDRMAAGFNKHCSLFRGLMLNRSGLDITDGSN